MTRPIASGPVDDFHAPPPTPNELTALAGALGVAHLGVARRLTGGLGCTMDVLTDGVRRVVLRRYGPWHEADSDVADREAAALRVAGGAGVPVPEAIWVDDSELFDRKAIVISYLEGGPDLDPDDPEAWASQLAAALAAIHAVDVGEARFPEVERGRVEREHPEPPERITGHDLGPAVWAARIAELETLPPATDRFIHTDFWPGNTMWSDGRLLAVVDWEEPAVGDPMLDVAYALTDMSYIGLGVGPHFVDEYARLSGNDTASLRYWRLVAACRPMPDIAQWVPAWQQMGLDVTVDLIRGRHRAVIESLLEDGA